VIRLSHQALVHQELDEHIQGGENTEDHDALEGGGAESESNHLGVWTERLNRMKAFTATFYKHVM
jgi:hypothetical protein